MKQKIFCTSLSALNTSATQYLCPTTLSAPAAAFLDSAVCFPIGGVLSNLKARHYGTHTSGNYAYSIVNEAGTELLSVTVNLATGTTVVSDADEVEITAGTLIAIKSVPGSPSIGQYAWLSFDFTPATDQRIILGSNAGASDLPVHATTPYYLFANGPDNAGNTNEISNYFPIAGTVKSLFVHLGTAPGADQSRTLSISINGSIVGAPSVTISGTDTEGNNAADIAINPGDTISIKCLSTSAAALSRVHCGIVVQPTTNGQFPIMSGSYGYNLHTTNTGYLLLSTPLQDPTSSTYIRTLGSDDFAIVGAVAKLSGTAGDGKSYTIQLQENNADTDPNFEMVIGGASDTTDSIAPGTYSLTPAGGQGMRWEIVPSGTPTGRYVWISAVGYIAPTEGGTETPITPAGEVTPSGSLSKQITILLSSALQPSGLISKQSPRAFAGALEPAGALGTMRAVLANLSGSIALAGAITKQAGKSIAGSIASAGAFAKQIARSLAGSLGLSGAIANSRTIMMSLAGSLTPTKALATARRYVRSFAGVISMHSARGEHTGASYNISFDGLIAPIGAIAKSTWKSFLGLLTPNSSGATEIIKTYILGISGAITATGNVVKRTARSFAGVLGLAGELATTGAETIYFLAVSGVIQPTGARLRQISKGLSSAITPIGAFARKVTASRAFAGGITPSGLLDTLKAKAIRLSGAILPRGTLRKSTAKPLSGSIAMAGSIAKSIAKALAGIIEYARSFAAELLGLSGTTPARRTYIVPAESRVFVIYAESRTYEAV